MTLRLVRRDARTAEEEGPDRQVYWSLHFYPKQDLDIVLAALNECDRPLGYPRYFSETDRHVLICSVGLPDSAGEQNDRSLAQFAGVEDAVRAYLTQFHKRGRTLVLPPPIGRTPPSSPQNAKGMTALERVARHLQKAGVPVRLVGCEPASFSLHMVGVIDLARLSDRGDRSYLCVYRFRDAASLETFSSHLRASSDDESVVAENGLLLLHGRTSPALTETTVSAFLSFVP
jgi:hypothetical protein